MGKRAPGLFPASWRDRGLAQISWNSTNNQVFWKALPILTPFLSPVHGAGTNFVIGGIFTPIWTNTPPPELIAEITPRTNLVYYDWEITQARLSHWHMMAQLLAVIADQPQFSTNTAGLAWIRTIGKHLGNSVTEVTQDSPKDFSAVRKSHIGLTGAEIVTLTRWLESTNFPRLTFDLPPTHVKPYANAPVPAKPATSGTTTPP